ncbi:MAG: hypothetical protein RL376_1136 [Verrucomicrobiota bacterium]|jgi:cyclophilin family peptidyl-prolyl cis-trans isomerase
MKLRHRINGVLLVLFFCVRSWADATVPVVTTTPAELNLAVGTSAHALDLTTVFGVPGVTGQIAQFDTILGKFNVELLAAAAPLHVANFLSYVTAGSYAGTFFHRVAYFEDNPAGPSILQGGGYYTSSGLPAVTKSPAINLEYNLPNARGTLAAARTSSPNSATSEWFFNTRDNSTILGPLNDGYGYSVFARVIGTGMDLVDSFANQPLYNVGFGAVITPIIPYAGQLYFCTIFNITVIPLFPASDGQTAVIAFTVSSSLPSVATATLINGSTLSVTPLALGATTLTLTATDTNGNTAQTTFSVNVASAFATYLANAGVPTDQRSSAADPDSDGVSNLLEYALGTNPNSAASNSLPSVSRLPAPGSLLQLTYKRAASDLTYTVQTTTNLADAASWTAVGVDQGIPAGDGTITATIPYTTGLRFLRLHVSVTP